MNLPNKLTLIRVALTPLFISCFYLPGKYAYAIAAAVFLLAYITDFFDGQIARRQNIVTDFGKLMDPIADKLLSSAALIMLVAFKLVSPVPVIIIIGREFIISGVRLVAAGRGNVIAASWLGKIKTVSQFAAVLTALLYGYLFPNWQFLVPVTLWFSVVFAIWSGYDYVNKSRGFINVRR